MDSILNIKNIGRVAFQTVALTIIKFRNVAYIVYLKFFMSEIQFG